MSYQVVTPKFSDSNQVILKRDDTWRYLGAFIFLLFGLAGSLFGWMAIWGGATGVAAHMIAGMGLAFLGGGMLILSSRLPKRLVFDNNQGALVIHEGVGSSVPPVVLPYEDIEGFQVRTRVSQSGRTRSVQYVVDLLKTDGAFWSLYSSNFEHKSNALLEKLIARVDLERVFSGGTLDRSIKGIGFSENQGFLEVLWPVRVSLTKFAMFAGVFGGFATIAWGLKSEMGSIIAYGILGFVGLLFSLLVYSFIASLGKTQVVAISSDTLKAYQKGGILPSGKSFEMRIEDCQAILFNYSTHQEDSAMYFLREEDRSMMQRMKQGDVSLTDLGGMFGTMMSVKSIHLEGHTIGEMLYVEHLLQEKIFERTGHVTE